MTGYLKKDLEAKCSDGILRHIDQMCEELCLSRCPLGKTLTNGKNRKFTHALDHNDGCHIPLTVKVSPIRDENCNIIGAVELFTASSRQLNGLRRLAHLKKDAMTDQLTGVGNRQFGGDKLRESLENLNRCGVSFGLLFIDVDHFKNVNDTYGHNIGDKVLIVVAQTISNALRDMDELARWGGDEFVVIVSDVTEDEFHDVARRVHEVIEGSWLSINNVTIKVTISIGGAMAEKGDTIGSLVERADLLMFKSKNAGRNRIFLKNNGCGPEEQNITTLPGSSLGTSVKFLDYN